MSKVGVRIGSFDWTDEADSALSEKLSSGMSCSKIAQVMGISRNSVVGRVYRLRKTGKLAPRILPPPVVIRDRRRVARYRSRPYRRALPDRVRSEPLPEPENAGRVHILELGSSSCRWVTSLAELLFCGRQVEPEKSYCRRHCAESYRDASRYCD